MRSHREACAIPIMRLDGTNHLRSVIALAAVLVAVLQVACDTKSSAPPVAEGSVARPAAPVADVSVSKSDAVAVATPPASSTDPLDADLLEPPAYFAEISSRLVEETCPRVRAKLLPPLKEVLRTKPIIKGVPESAAYYYGIGRPVDYEKALAAAYGEREDGGSVFGDIAILMMLFANGFGVERDVDVALALACEYEGAPAELEGRVAHLESLRKGGADKPFDVCDDVTSNYMESWCEDLANIRRSVELNAELDSVTRAWPASHLAALQRVRDAHEALLKARSANEVPQLEPSTTLQMTWLDGAVQEEFAATLRLLASDEPPAIDASEVARTDRELNDVYKKVLAYDFQYTTVNPRGVRKTQRLWLKYRDAWLALAAVRKPDRDTGALQASLNRERTRQLRELSAW